MDLAPSLALNFTGGAAALLADRNLPDYNVDVGPVTITVGAMGGLALAGLLLLFPGFPAHAFFSELAAGAVAFEGAKAFEAHVVPTVESWLSEKNKALKELKAANENGRQQQGAQQPAAVKGFINPYSPYYTPAVAGVPELALRSSLANYWRVTRAAA